MSHVWLKKKGVDQLSNLDHVATNASSSQCEAQLYIFEDYEAVIKMIIKGRSPMMRHVSRTHSVALDLFFDRINLDPKFHIKYVDTRKQLADLLTKGSFTCDAWCNPLRLFNIMFFCVLSQPFSFNWKGEHHVEEFPRKEDRRRACGSDTEADKKPTERTTSLFFRFGCFQYPGESAAGIRVCET